MKKPVEYEYVINRIQENEKMLDDALVSIKNLEDALISFKSNIDNIKLLDKYYGSKEWLSDKKNLEKGIINNIKAGVLSEDLIWNMLDDVNYLMSDMKNVCDYYGEKYEK